MLYYYYEKKKGADECGVESDIKSSVLESLYAITENSWETPVQEIRNADELPKADDEASEDEEAQIAACNTYLENGGQYPFYLVKTPGEPVSDAYSCYTDDNIEWESVLNEWESYTDSGCTTFFDDPAEFIKEAIDNGDEYRARTVIKYIFGWDAGAQDFVDILKAVDGNIDNLRSIVGDYSKDGDLCLIYQAAGVDEMYVNEVVDYVLEFIFRSR